MSTQRYEEELGRMAEYIATHPPDISPEMVGSKLADAEAPIDTFLKGEQRSAALRERAEARAWLMDEAIRRGYPRIGAAKEYLALAEREEQGEYEKPMPTTIRYSWDSATRYMVTLDIETGVRRDNPAWFLAIQDAIIKGKWNIIAQQPIASEAEAKEYNEGLLHIHILPRRL